MNISKRIGFRILSIPLSKCVMLIRDFLKIKAKSKEQLSEVSVVNGHA